MKLYQVKLRGFYDNPIGAPMVVATDPTTAYEMVRKWLEDKDYGFRKDQELASVELVADDYEYTDAPSRLFLQNSKDYTKSSGG
ncbi:MAG: hypothetical protein AAGA96_09715 [Verrucomicrobiota bacterium]